MDHTKHIKATQIEPAKEGQVVNNAGGYVFDVGPWKQLHRFLILGSEGGTYYVNERTHTRDNVKCLDTCLAQDPAKVVEMIANISQSGRAPKNDTAIFALAYAAKKAPSPDAAYLAYQQLSVVCRTGTHLYQFANAISELAGWGAGSRKAVSRWYKSKSPKALAKHAVKYRSRKISDNTWTHRDLIRVAHVRWSKRTENEVAMKHNTVLQYMLDASKLDHTEFADDKDLAQIYCFEQLKSAETTKAVVEMIEKYNPPWESLPTQFLKEPAVWEAIINQGMPLTALIRNLGRMSSIGLLKPLSTVAAAVTKQLGNDADLAAARIHPISVLAALKTYASGHGARGKLSWSPVPTIVDALDAAFYKSFGFIEPSGKRMMLAIDVSGSMTGNIVAGIPGLSANMAAAAMAMLFARLEEEYYIMGFAKRFRDLKITAKDSLESAMKKAQDMAFGSTDCSVAFDYARENKLDVDCFGVITDNETYAGRSHPFAALKAYRSARVVNARSWVMATTATPFTIADPSDPGMLDVVGFDTATPQLVCDFAAALW